MALNLKNELSFVAAGDVVKSHGKVVRVIGGLVKVPIKRPSNIVISIPGHLKDIDLYQAARAANNFVCGSDLAVKREGF